MPNSIRPTVRTVWGPAYWQRHAYSADTPFCSWSGAIGVCVRISVTVITIPIVILIITIKIAIITIITILIKIQNLASPCSRFRV